MALELAGGAWRPCACSTLGGRWHPAARVCTGLTGVPRAHDLPTSPQWVRPTPYIIRKPPESREDVGTVTYIHPQPPVRTHKASLFALPASPPHTPAPALQCPLRASSSTYITHECIPTPAGALSTLPAASYRWSPTRPNPCPPPGLPALETSPHPHLPSPLACHVPPGLPHGPPAGPREPSTLSRPSWRPPSGGAPWRCAPRGAPSPPKPPTSPADSQG